MPYLLICRARPKMLARLPSGANAGEFGDEDGDPVAQQFTVEVGITWKTAKYMSNIFFTMRISHDCFCNGQPGRLAFTGSVLLVCKYSHAIMHKRLRLRRTSFVKAAFLSDTIGWWPFGGSISDRTHHHETLGKISELVMLLLMILVGSSKYGYGLYNSDTVWNVWLYDTVWDCRAREREVQYDTVWSSCFQLDYIHVSMNQIATSKLQAELEHISLAASFQNCSMVLPSPVWVVASVWNVLLFFPSLFKSELAS